MIRFPKTLQQIHIFKEKGVMYVANLQTGDVLQINILIADILELCDTCDNISIVEKLKGKYSERDILEGLISLEGEIETLLFSPGEELEPSTTQVKDKLRLFIPHGFMKYKEILCPNTNVGIYNLLIALTKYAEVFVESDSSTTMIKQRERLMALGIQFVSDIFESTDLKGYAANRFVIDDCDGILALSPHPYDELNYFRHNSIPIISRIYNDRNLRELTINKVFSHQTLQRDFDLLCPETPWLIDELASFKSFHQKGLRIIPNGIDIEVYRPQNRQHSREAVAELVEEKNILDAPIVGVLNGFQPQNSIGMIAELAHLHKDVVFIVIDSISSRHQSQHRNVFHITLKCPEDIIALPWIYNACEFIIFPTVIGTSFSMILEAFACGIPGLALNSAKLPAELSGCIKSVPLTQNDNTGRFITPTAAVSEQINTLIRDSEMREKLSAKAKKIALNYSWDKTAKRFVDSFITLNQRKIGNRDSKFSKVIFSPYYDKAQNVIKTGAMELDGLLKQTVEEGLVQTLLFDHTPEEVWTVLWYLFQDPDKANKLLATFIPNRFQKIEDSIPSFTK